jgi:hypothetical protein
MPKNKLFLLVSLITVLGLVAAAAVMVGRATPLAQSNADPDLLVPAANMPLNANWKAQPAKGAAVSLAWSNIRVNTDTGSEAQNEPSVMVDPHNAQHLVVGANNWQSGTGQFEVYAYVSFNGGKTWAASQPYINRNASRLNAADPTVAFGSDGTVYFAFVAFSPAQGAVAVSRSVDGGLTWAAQSWATSFTSAADKPTLGVFKSNLYLYWQGLGLQTRVSPDSGATWGTVSTVDAAGRNAAPVVDAQGNVNVFYNTTSSINLARTTNGGASYNLSTVSSATALQARPTHYRATVYATAGVAPNGTLYVAWADGRNTGRGNDILLSYSTDSVNWSAPITVNSDASSADQLMPALTVGRDGVATVAWLDNRNDSNNYNYDVYMARLWAGPGIQRLTADQRVTNVASNPDNDPRTQGTLIGDYFALAAGPTTVYPVWTDTRNNNEDIYIAPISVGSSPNQ